MHDHSERAITTDGIAPGGNISQIVYRKYLNKNAMATTQGEDLSAYFNPQYYQGKLATWSAADPFGFFDDVAGAKLSSYKEVLLIIVLGVLLGLFVLLFVRLFADLYSVFIKRDNK